MYAIVFTDTTGQPQCSRFFQKLSAARKYAKWMTAQAWATNVTIYRGGPGGEIVK